MFYIIAVYLHGVDSNWLTAGQVSILSVVYNNAVRHCFAISWYSSVSCYSSVCIALFYLGCLLINTCAKYC